MWQSHCAMWLSDFAAMAESLRPCRISPDYTVDASHNALSPRPPAMGATPVASPIHSPTRPLYSKRREIPWTCIGCMLRCPVWPLQLQSVAANANIKADLPRSEQANSEPEDSVNSFPAAQLCEPSALSGGMLAEHAPPSRLPLPADNELPRDPRNLKEEHTGNP